MRVVTRVLLLLFLALLAVALIGMGTESPYCQLYAPTKRMGTELCLLECATELEES